MSFHPTMFENPFRDGGEISKDADDIVDAFKNGKLSEISNPGGDIKDWDINKDDENRESIVQPLERKNGMIAVKTDAVMKTEKDKLGQEIIEPEKEKKYYCCVVS